MSDNLSPVGKKKPCVRLVGEDGNAFAIMGRVVSALRRSGYTAEEIAQYRKAATAGNYDALLCATLNWVNEVGEVNEDEEVDEDEDEEITADEEE